jgi:hypothetical protein
LPAVICTVAPLAEVNVPVCVPLPTSVSVPLCASTVPVLLNGNVLLSPITVSPVVTVFFSTPELLKVGVAPVVCWKSASV